MNDENFLNEGVRRAQEIGRQGEFRIGQTIAHPSDPLTYAFRGVSNGIAILGLTATQSPTGKAAEREFPLREIFDPHVARDEALSAKSECVASLFPGAIVCRFGA